MINALTVANIGSDVTVTLADVTQFIPLSPIGEQIRKDKKIRQAWYKDPATRHQFYTLIAGLDPNRRVNKGNPPAEMRGLVVDIDLHMDPAQFERALKPLRRIPSAYEVSLGGNHRLVYLFEAPIKLFGMAHAAQLIQEVARHLKVDKLPGLDEQAMLDPARMYCNGCEWEAGFPDKIPADFFSAVVSKAQEDFAADKNKRSIKLPLDIAQRLLKEAYPKFAWPGEFLYESTGPSFFVEGSESPNSAILKEGGFYTFSAHASQPFYTWECLLGRKAIQEFQQQLLSDGAKDVYFDGKTWYAKGPLGDFRDYDSPGVQRYLRVNRGVRDSKEKGDELSMMDRVLSQVDSYNRVDGSSPLVGFPSGVVEQGSARILNNTRSSVMQPAEAGSQVWGKDGKFPKLSELLDVIFDGHEQLPYWLTWWRRYYESFLKKSPVRGHAIFLAGGGSVGKTFLASEILGASVGGYRDAVKHLSESQAFNDEMFDVPLWSVNDETSLSTEASRTYYHAAIKAAVANTTHRVAIKFRKPVSVQWMGRIAVTCNLDYVSSRALPSMDESFAEKVCLFRATQHPRFTQFGTDAENQAWVAAELPFFLRWLLDYHPPDWIKPEVRFGFMPYHDSELVSRAQQTSPEGPFIETLSELLDKWFVENPEQPAWTGTTMAVQGLVQRDAIAAVHMRSVSAQQLTRLLERTIRSGRLGASVEMVGGYRVWKFTRL